MKPKSNFNAFAMLIGVIVIIAVIGIVGYLFANGYIFRPSTTLTTTILSPLNVSPIDNCMVINRPGKYYLALYVKTGISGGACINVSASNVNIVCNGNRLTGSGPFDAIPPYTYAIQIIGQKNVNISGCIISNFSYGVYALNSRNINIMNSNLSINYMSDIELNNTQNATVSRTYLSRSSSTQGALYLTNGTIGSRIENNTIQYNQYYGININSTPNMFFNNHLNGTQFSFYCSPAASFVKGSAAGSNLCYNNSGCGFLQCRGINIPANISKVMLTGQVNTCGAIKVPGHYVLISNIDMNNFVNTSNPLATINPCILIQASNVQLNCNNHTITNATTAIIAQNVSNVDVRNCDINHSQIAAISLYRSSLFHFSNLKLISDNIGIGLYSNSTTNNFANITATNNYYGIYMSGAYSNSFQDVNSSKNAYGFYLENSSLSNSFNRVIAVNNTKLDVYTSPDSTNATLNLMQSTTCGTTDAVWATCAHFIAIALPYVPLNSCTSIKVPGNYLLETSIVSAQPQCMKITADNVALNCSNHFISSSYFTRGPALSIANSNNVTVNNCKFIGFTSGINVSTSYLVSFNRVSVNGSIAGITFSHVQSPVLTNSSINGTMNGSIILSYVYGGILRNNNITYGINKNTGILLSNSSNNQLFNNTVTRSNIAFELLGKSTNNTVTNNTAQDSESIDYLCTQGPNSGTGTENGGINYGTVKIGCHWMAAITTTNPTAPCEPSLQPKLFNLVQDAIYGVGSTCFSAYNQTTINCNGHTILATNNGTFATFHNAQNSQLENCYLKGFAVSVIAKNSSVTIYNNSMYDTYPGATVVNVSNSRSGVLINQNNITGSSRGIYLYNLTLATLQNNLVSDAGTAYVLSAVNVSSVFNNTADSSDLNGMMVTNSLFDLFKNNNFQGSSTGLACYYDSQGSTNSSDYGNNRCSVNSDCFWITSSSGTCH